MVHDDTDRIHKNQVNIQYYVFIGKSFEKSRKIISFEHMFIKKKQKKNEERMFNSAIKCGIKENDCIFKMRLECIVGVKHNLRM